MGKHIEIIVDGTPQQVSDERQSYADIVTLAYADYPQHPDVSYSVTYKHGPPQNREGILSKGGSVEVKGGMEFRVSRTGQS
jgi:hypothetical protein